MTVRITHSDAWIEGNYRYLLLRKWADGPVLGIGMLNPSTADAERPDPTLLRCIHFASAWGFGGLIVFNPFALRSPSPKALLVAEDPIGPLNDNAICVALSKSHARLVAWGRPPHASLISRIKLVEQRILNHGGRVYCLGRTMEGYPKHPLARGVHRVSNDQQPIPYEV